MKFKSIKSPILNYSLITIATVTIIIILFILSVYLGMWGKLPDKKELSNLQYQKASEVYSADSVLIGKYYVFDRQPIAYEEFPKTLLNALIAIEDERFYEHSGIDYKSLVRVGFKSILMQDQSAGGGSTLTQQLAKNLYPRKERIKTNIIVDKLKEMMIASRLEATYSKEKILYHYLNTVSFGDNTFGIESAALKFFNKKTKKLTIEEAAVLVGMLKATYSYNPRVFPENSLKRRNLVFQAMFLNGFLKETEKDSLLQIPLKLVYKEYNYNDGIAPYFREEVRKLLLSWTKIEHEKGKDYNIYTSGLKIYTTLNYKMQVLAEQAMAEHLAVLQQDFEKSYGRNAPWLNDKKLIDKVIKKSSAYKQLKVKGVSEVQIIDSLRRKKTMILADWEGEKTVEASTIDSLQHYLKFLNTGSLGIDPNTGAVKTWIGGANFKYYKYDHISQSKRQVGSTFKPMVYTAALENGISPCRYFSAQEVAYKNLKGWSPSNSGSKEEAYLNYSMEEALSNSVNTVAVKVLEEVGILNVIRQANKMGILEKLPNEPSLALGTGELKITELAGAYASYVNNSKPVTPYLIDKITNNRDSIIHVFKPNTPSPEAFSSETRQLMLEMMKSTINTGTASRIRNTYKLTNAIAGKTGTTQDNKDAWFVGITPKLVHITWVGLDNHELGFKNTSLGQGANAALPMFALFMQKLNKDLQFSSITRAQFETPSANVLHKLACDPVKKDGFLKRLFKNPDKKKSKNFKQN